ncbi:MAG: hypothetical protein ACRDRN_22885 [Sciscionella sp.]
MTPLWLQIAALLVAALSLAVAFSAEWRARRATRTAQGAERDSAEALRRLAAVDGVAGTVDGRFAWVFNPVGPNLGALRNLGPDTATGVEIISPDRRIRVADINASPREIAPNASIPVIHLHGLGSTPTYEVVIQWDQHPDPFAVPLPIGGN